MIIYFLFQVTFEVSIEATKCPTGESKWEEFSIYPVGLTETLTIRYKLICECDCEKPGQGVCNVMSLV